MNEELRSQMVKLAAWGFFMKMVIKMAAVAVIAIAVGDQFGTNYGYMSGGLGILLVWW